MAFVGTSLIAIAPWFPKAFYWMVAGRFLFGYAELMHSGCCVLMRILDSAQRRPTVCIHLCVLSH